tara:strand:+ start:1157 stop:2188 length:1032 start_codon:yes stop_codon:yes gene_type:complete
MALKTINKLLLVVVSLFAGCQQPDYAIVKGGDGETVYVEVEIEVPGPTVEIPVYIEVEVPVEHGDIWVDSFTQPMSIDGIDILWVIDRSGSMNRYNTELLNGVQAMLSALPTADWRLVMISADPNKSILSSEFPLVPGDTIADAEAMLNTLTSAPYEEGFNSVYEYMTLNPYSSTWMRPEAGLLVVFVSDEEEQSHVEYPTPSDFLSWYQTQRMGSVFMASVVNQDATVSLCDYPPNPIDVGDRYMDATNILGGTVVDICDEDWAPGVTDATHSVDPYESLKLTHTPDPPAAIRVFVNGSLNHDWYFNSSDNTVYFTVIPAAGDLVEIGYLYYETSDTGDSGQ